MDFDYKKYSLEQLEKWVHDAMSADASPHEIYSAIREAVRKDYYYHKDRISRASGLLELMSGNRPVKDNSVLKCDKDDPSPECKEHWNDFWEEHYYPEEHKETKKGHSHSKYWYEHDRNGANRPNPFNKEKDWTITYDEAVASGWEMTADGFWIKDKVKRWVLPVEEVRDEDTDKDEYCVTLPDDLLEAANLKEGDQIEWTDNDDGSYSIRKVTKPLGMDDC
jgi:hypothetical protein